LRFGDRSDEELMELARAGWAPAFAVLVHRHAPLVHAAVQPTPDPRGAIVGVFSEAMRQLDQRDASAGVAPWLTQLAGGGPVGDPRPLPPEELDDIWIELNERWPDGHRPAPALPWRRVGVLVALVAVAAIVPSVLLGTDHEPNGEDLLELRAIPVEDERSQQPQVEPEFETPDFTFPEGPEADEPPAPEPEPAPDATPEPAPAPEPTAPTQQAPGEATESEESAEAEQEPTDDEDDGSNGLLDGLVGDEDGDGGDGDGGDEEPEEPAEPGTADETEEP
jgi:hypothetical protein